MSWQLALRKAEAWAQEEQGAQLRLLAAIEAHEATLSGNDPDAIEASLGKLRTALEGESSRTARRREWLATLGQHWGVDPGTLTLGSVVERAGADGERLARQRIELQAVARKVAAGARRVSLVARTQRSVVGEILGVLTGVDPTSDVESRGSLVHLEA